MLRLLLRRRLGLTMVELLVVLAIIGASLALLLPAVGAARQAARDSTCMNNLRQVCLGMSQLLELQGELPAGPKSGYAGGWSVKVLDFLEERPLMKQIDGRPLQALPAIGHARPEIMSCLSNTADASGVGKIQAAHYALLGGSISDVPADYRAPWPAGPIGLGDNFMLPIGPHRGGYMQGDYVSARVQLVIREH